MSNKTKYEQAKEIFLANFNGKPEHDVKLVKELRLKYQCESDHDIDGHKCKNCMYHEEGVNA